jgi:cellobiose-specific phosphotransferase system component IIA
MIDRKRYQKLELRILELEAENRQLTARLVGERELHYAEQEDKLRSANSRLREAYREEHELLGELESSRSIAASLEAEIHACPAEQFHAAYAYREDGSDE